MNDKVFCENIMKDFLHVGANGIIKRDNSVWIATNMCNVLCTFDLDRYEFEIQHLFDKNGITMKTQFRKLILKDNFIFCFPCIADCIYIYAIDSKKTVKIKIPNAEDYNSYRTIQYEKYVFLVADTNDLLCFNLQEKHFEDSKRVCPALFKLICTKKKEEKIFIECDEKIYLYNKTKSVLYEIRSLGEEKLLKRLSFDRKIEIAQLNYSVHKLWFLPMNTFGVYSYDVEQDLVETYEDKDPIYYKNYNKIPYCKIIEFQDELILLNYYGQNMKKIDLENKKIYPLKASFEDESYLNVWSMYIDAIEFQGKLFIFPSRGSNLLIYDKKEIQKIKACITKKNKLFYAVKYYTFKETMQTYCNVMPESTESDLSDLIMGLCFGEKADEK